MLPVALALAASQERLAPSVASALVICLDPGHTSEVGEGTRGRSLTELRFAWDVAQDLGPLLRQDGYQVVLTKPHMLTKVTNRQRAEVANRYGAALMLRLHCDAATNSGSTIYYPTHPGRAADGKTGPSPEMLKRTARIAKDFADGYQARLLGTYLRYNGLLSDDRTAIGAKQGALTGSIYSQVPTVLVEMVVLTNPHDEEFARSAKGRTIVVQALCRGIRRAIPLRATRPRSGVPSRAATSSEGPRASGSAPGRSGRGRDPGPRRGGPPPPPEPPRGPARTDR